MPRVCFQQAPLRWMVKRWMGRCNSCLGGWEGERGAGVICMQDIRSQALFSSAGELFKHWFAAVFYCTLLSCIMKLPRDLWDALGESQRRMEHKCCMIEEGIKWERERKKEKEMGIGDLLYRSLIDEEWKWGEEKWEQKRHMTTYRAY